MVDNEKEDLRSPGLKKRISLGISKFRSLIKRMGLWGAVAQIMRNIFWIEIMYRFVKDLDVQENRVKPKIPLRIITMPQDLDVYNWEGRKELLEIRGEYGLLQFQQRLQRGYILFCAYSEVKFAGFLWLLPPPVTRIDSGVLLKDDEAYQIDGWTFNDYRGKGVLPSLQQATYDYARKEFPHVKSVVTHGAIRNIPSVVGQQRSGLIIVSRELSVSIFGYNRKIKLSNAIE